MELGRLVIGEKVWMDPLLTSWLHCWTRDGLK